MADTAAVSDSGDSFVSTDAVKDDPQSKPTNPLLSLLCNFLKLFNLTPPTKKKEIEPASSEPKPADVVDETPAVVKFPRKELPSLKFESEGAEPDTNPVVLWQVYAIGGFFVMKWAWTRWNERHGKKKPSDEEPPPNQD